MAPTDQPNQTVPHRDSYLYLTTRGRTSGLPREIEIWFTQDSGKFYLIAEHATSHHWVRNLQADPNVQVRVAGRKFAARARVRVLSPETDSALIAVIQALSRQKYRWGDGLVVELAPEQSRR